MAKEYIITNSASFVFCMQEISKAVDAGVHFKLTARKIKGTKSQKQLGYYWGVVMPCILRDLYESGYTRHDYSLNRLHNEFKLMFFYIENTLLKTDTVVRTPKSLAKASVKEMATYVDNVIMWAAQNDIEIPEPDF
jgi:hypothetical protein